jgi:Na+-translocating ferredoxin:NAD+ oxidoreductase RNF subunit RnfB
LVTGRESDRKKISGIGEMIEAVLTLSGIGLIASLGLGLAARKFAVRQNPMIERVEQVLPGINCGACGMASCNAYAKAVVDEGAPVNACIPGGEKTAQLVAEIIGVEVSQAESYVAVLLCKGGKREARSKFEYQGLHDCKAAMIIAGGDKSCRYGCLGLGTCERVCPFDAIVVDANGLPVVDLEKCTGCGICVRNCPKAVLLLAPRGMAVHVRCHSHDKAGQVKRVCSVGCIGCGACVRICPYEALSLEDGLAIMNYGRCRQCGLCVDQCPTQNITSLIEGPPKAEIHPSRCVGRAACEAACPVNAISGKPGETHVVDPDRCIGCRICSAVCPVHAVSMGNGK